MGPRKKAVLAACAAHDKKGADILLLDVRRRADFADYFVIVTSTSAVRSKAIADHIIERLNLRGEDISHMEGYPNSHWVLLDTGSVIVHIFLPEAREFYSLERLWGDAPQTRYPQAECPA